MKTFDVRNHLSRKQGCVEALSLNYWVEGCNLDEVTHLSEEIEAVWLKFCGGVKLK